MHTWDIGPKDTPPPQFTIWFPLISCKYKACACARGTNDTFQSQQGIHDDRTVDVEYCSTTTPKPRVALMKFPCTRVLAEFVILYTSGQKGTHNKRKQKYIWNGGRKTDTQTQAHNGMGGRRAHIPDAVPVGRVPLPCSPHVAVDDCCTVGGLNIHAHTTGALRQRARVCEWGRQDKDVEEDKEETDSEENNHNQKRLTKRIACNVVSVSVQSQQETYSHLDRAASDGCAH